MNTSVKLYKNIALVGGIPVRKIWMPIEEPNALRPHAFRDESNLSHEDIPAAEVLMQTIGDRLCVTATCPF